MPGIPGQVPFIKEWVVGDTHRNTDEIVDKMLQDKDMRDILGDMEANEITEDSINQYRETKKKCGR